MYGGSSPLARGLPRPAGDGAVRPGIIPARAGFTTCARRGPGSWKDHPRSRGVYPAWSRAAGGLRGSSPLARGLRGLHSPHHRGRRIIPARAGFTLTCAMNAHSPRDHPRSRGVYGSAAPPVNRSPGSSPLARGLLPTRPLCGGRPRIIPARAGFTGLVAVAAASALGSSPLARGLRLLGEREADGRGIIPARAGFTWWR